MLLSDFKYKYDQKYRAKTVLLMPPGGNRLPMSNERHIVFLIHS